MPFGNPFDALENPSVNEKQRDVTELFRNAF